MLLTATQTMHDSLVTLDCKAEDALNVVAREGRVGQQHIILRQLARCFDCIEVFIPAAQGYAK